MSKSMRREVGFNAGSEGPDEARSFVARNVQWMVGVDSNSPQARLLELEQEARDKNHGEAAKQVSCKINESASRAFDSLGTQHTGP